MGLIGGVALCAIVVGWVMQAIGDWAGVAAGFLMVSLLWGGFIYDCKHGKI